MATTNLLTDITLSTALTCPTTFVDMAGLTDTVTVAGTGSVILLIATVTLETIASDQCADFRFTHDSSQIGPMVSTTDDNAAGEGNSVTITHALTGLAAGTHAFSLQWRDVKGTPDTQLNFDRTFQVIEFTSGCSIVIDISSATVDTAGTTYSDISNMTGTFTPTANSLHLFMFNAVVEQGSSGHYADFQFEIGTTLEGPACTAGKNAADEFYTSNIMWARTGLAASSTDVAVRWRGIAGTADAPGVGNARFRTFQILEFTSNFSLETDIEITSSATAPTTLALMTGMQDTDVNVDSTDSVALAIACYNQAKASDYVNNAQLRINGSLNGPETRDFTDSSTGGGETVSTLLAYAVTGISGASIDFELYWVNARGSPTIDTGRERTFQVIDFKNAGGVADLIQPPLLHSFATARAANY